MAKMAFKLYLSCIFLLLCSTSVFGALKLKLVHVLSANKFYVPDVNQTSTTFEPPKNLSYRYFLENSVDIPNSVKLHLFNLGAHLREKYDGFLGSMYVDEVIKMQTTEFPVSIIAGELINAGLWPPVGEQIWNKDLPWQPIPFGYNLQEEDTHLLGTLCPNFAKETDSILKTHGNLSAQHATLLDNINKQLNITATNAIDVSLLYLALENSAELNQQLPPIIRSLYPPRGDFLLNFSLSAYDLLSQSLLQRQLNGGSLLKNIVEDSKNSIAGELPAARKINVYSGDERVFMGVVKNLMNPAQALPAAGAALIFELLDESGVYFVKTDYYLGPNVNETITLTLDGCAALCPFENFTSIVSRYFPSDDLKLCGSMVSGSSGGKGDSGKGDSGKGDSGKGGAASSVAISNGLIAVVSIVAYYATSVKLI